MQRSERKNSRLKTRVEELSHELSRVEEEMRALSKATRHPDREAAARRLRRVTEEQEKGRTMPATRTPVGSVPAERPAGSESAVREPPAAGSGAPTGGEPVPRGIPDPRFANYFVTGGLHSVRPLRQERRVQRNRAILMLLLAIVLLYGVLSLLF